MSPAHTPDTTAWQLTRERARSDPPGDWRVTPTEDGFAVAAARAG